MFLRALLWFGHHTTNIIYVLLFVNYYIHVILHSWWINLNSIQFNWIGSQTYIDVYNSEIDGVFMALKETNDTNLVVAICTPLMQCVHTHLGGMVFIDASSNMDRYGCSVFLILTHSSAGGLPLGVFVTTSESQDNIAAAFNLYLSILPPTCFTGERKTRTVGCQKQDK